MGEAMVVMVLVFLLGGWPLGEGCWEQEKIGLLQLKPFFNYDNALHNWVDVEGKESSDCCRWERVECDATTGRVIQLNLWKEYSHVAQDGENLRQPRYLNASLFLPFEELKSLDLRGHQIAGCLDNEGFEKLWGTLDKLEDLDLDDNQFNNSILSSLIEFSSLKSLDLSFNNLTKFIHTDELNKLINLEELWLWGNDIESFGSFGENKIQSSLINLKMLRLDDNRLNNSIFSSLGAFPNLKELYIRGNNIKGSVVIKELNNLINLETLYLSNNEIESFGSFGENKRQSSLINLKMLNLDGNRLNNSIFSSLGAFPNLKQLSILGNNIKGSVVIKERDALSKLEQLDMSDNEVNAVVISQGARGLKNLKLLYLREGSATNNSVLLRSLGCFPLLKTLHLEHNNFNGTETIQELRNLTYLEGLFLDFSVLQKNFLQGVGELTSLKRLSLSNSARETSGGLSNIRGICELKRLEELYITDHNLRGTLPDCFSNLTFLRYLDLAFNQLSDNLVTSPLKTLTSLEEIDLSHNQFQIPISLKPLFNHSKLKYFSGENNNILAETEQNSLAPRFQLNGISLSCCGDVGPFPHFLHHQHELHYVALSHINLTGEFPSWLLENNTELGTLELGNNFLSGHFLLPFHASMKLNYLDISNNIFEGHIPEEIGAYLPQLQSLNVSKNSFNGSIPSSIGEMNLLETLDLSNNNFEGQIFSANFNLTNLRHLRLNGNHFIGMIPNSLSSCSILSTIDISDNHLSGRIPRWMGNLSHLKEIIMANNHIEGRIPVEFCQLGMLGVLDLSMNNISGTLPSCFSPPWINHVHLSKNRLRGPIPNKLCKSSNLVTMDLSNNHLTGNIPNCIGKLSSLSYLVLSYNNLEGEIPIQLCQLDKLSVIALSHNNLSGRIPHCLNVTPHEEIIKDSVYEYDPQYDKSMNTLDISRILFPTEEPIQVTTKGISYFYRGRILTYLCGIDLSYNKLTGEIPHEIGNFHEIVMLNLSYNSLTGLIPLSLSNLKKIESLDLSYNNLSGNIPIQFVDLTSLAYFNVSYNNLSGKPPPRKAQFASNIDENSYWGNSFLCGEPLLKKCSTIEASSNSTEDEEDVGLIDATSFYVTFIVSYIMVLLGIAAVLSINPYWRGAWFYLVEKCIYSCFYFIVDNLARQFGRGNM